MQSSQAPQAQSEEPSADPGTRLKREREAQKLSLEALAAELRIEAHLLAALEENRFDALGAPVFAKGYLKQYGARLGLDVADLVADYERLAGASSVEIAPPPTIRLWDERQVTIWTVSGLALVFVAGFLAWWWWDASEPVPGFVADDVEEPSFVLPPPIGNSPAPANEVTFEPEEVPVAVEDPVASGDAVLPNEGEANDQPPPAAEQAPVEADRVLEIVFVEDSWTEITDVAGEQLYYDLGRAGTRALVPADRELNLFFGNAAGVELNVDGETIPIPPSSRRGDLAQFDLEAPGTDDP